jgi:DNA repair protein RadD
VYHYSLSLILQAEVSPISWEPVALRPYQEANIGDLKVVYRLGHRAVLYVLPTGGGKTVVFSRIAWGALKKGTRTLIVAHRRELVRQAAAKLRAVGIEPGIIASGTEPDLSAMIQVGSIQTVNRRLDRIGEFGLIVVDEAHHSRSIQYTDLFEAQPDARILGVTATPARLDGKGLGKEDGGIFDAMVVGPQVDELVPKYLSPSLSYVPAKRLDLSGVRVVRGDYEADDLDRAVRGAQISGNAISEYKIRADHKPCLVFCCSIRHAQETAEEFRQAGYRAKMVCGDTPRDERDATLAGLTTGEVEVVTSCALIDEGLDVPTVGCIILLRPTKSLVLHRQQVGRGMRPGPGKTLIVLDHVGNSITHGLPSTRVEWSLSGLKKKLGVAPTWRCDHCGALNAVSDAVCAACGTARPGAKPRDEIETEAGRLEVLTAEMLARIQRMTFREMASRRRSEAELREFAKAKGYRPGWVQHRLREQNEEHP